MEHEEEKKQADQGGDEKKPTATYPLVRVSYGTFALEF